MRETMAVLAALLVCGSLGLASQAGSGEATVVTIRGRLRTADGSPVAGVAVRCLEIDPKYDYEFVWEQGRVASDEQGRYAFAAKGGREYRIAAGGTRSTFARSERFFTPANEGIAVDDLVVVPATGVLRGRIINADGSPAAGLDYACMSESFCPYRAFDYPQTGPDGEFHLDVLPAEKMAFWVVTSEDRVQMWPGLSPSDTDQVFRLDPGKTIAMPPEWKKFGDVQAVARQTWRTAVQGRIDFTVADLAGHGVSLNSDRFRGKAVLVNIFGTWCGGCMVEAPQLVRLKDKYGARGLEVVGIAFEPEPEETGRANLAAFIERHKIDYPVLFAGREKRANVLETIKGIERFSGYPTTIFIGRDGTVRDVKVGFKGETPERVDWQVRQFEEVIVTLLAEPAET